MSLGFLQKFKFGEKKKLEPILEDILEMEKQKK